MQSDERCRLREHVQCLIPRCPGACREQDHDSYLADCKVLANQRDVPYQSLLQVY